MNDLVPFQLDQELASQLAKKYGTPAYIFDESGFRTTIKRYKAAFAAAWPRHELTFASKANSTASIIKIAHEEGCKIDTASEGEFRAALLAGVPAHDCHLHGNNKSRDELKFALEKGIGQIILDHVGEIEMVRELGINPQTEFIIRLAPGVDPVTHAKISTGQADTKFGFNISDGSAEAAVKACLKAGIPIAGYHCHVGSQLLDPGAQISGGQAIGQFANEMLKKHGVEFKYLNLGGGLGVPYTPEQIPMPVEDYCLQVVNSVINSLDQVPEDLVLVQEPGRSLCATSGLTLYQVGAIKSVPAFSGRKAYVSVDGGMSDNPRPALYGSRYTVLPIFNGPRDSKSSLGTAFGTTESTCQATISGKHCETDTLFPDTQLPSQLQPGDWLQVLCTGAYGSSMASNYNRLLRPPTILLREDGSTAEIQIRETWDQLLAREVIIK